MSNSPACVKITSWNMNGGVPNKLAIIQKYCADCDIMFIQEHMLSPHNISLLKFSNKLTFHFEPAKIRSFGRPSAGLAIICHPYIESKVLFTHDHFLAISSGSIAFFNVYLPTNYHDDKSERKFMNAVRELAKCLKSVTQRDLHCLVLGDFNCNLLDSMCACSQLLNGIFDDKLIILPKDSDYSFVHNSGSVSSIDHTACSKNINGSVTVLKDAVFADHLPLLASLSIKPALCQPKNDKWKVVSEWDKVNTTLYHQVLNSFLVKIRIPFHLLQVNSNFDPADARVLINFFFCAEITHSLLIAEKKQFLLERLKWKHEFTNSRKIRP